MAFNLSFFHNTMQQIVQAIFRTMRRFPLTLLLFCGLAAVIIYRIETPYEKLKDINLLLDRLSGVSAMGIPFTLNLSLLMEKLGKEKQLSLKIWSYAGQLILLWLYFLFLFADTTPVALTRLLLVTLALVLAFFFIPYLPKKEHFETYVTTVITEVATTAFFTIVLALGLTAILFAVKSLLYTGMDPKVYGETWVLSWLVFAPVHFLANLPGIKDQCSGEDFNKVIKIMLLYIVLPLITVFTIVLYAYFAKILITQVWPKGVVSYLVVSYTAAGIAAIFLVTPFREENRWVRVFIAAFTKVIFPLLGMMFISIGMRIGQFGFTENRYFILVIGIWATLVMIFLNFSSFSQGRNTVLPVSLAIVALLTVLGPWNAFEVSKWSQSQRFYRIAARYQMVQDGQVVKPAGSVEPKDQQEISGVLRYFDQFHQLSELKYLPPKFTMDQMQTVFGFAETYPGNGAVNYFSYGGDRNLSLEISGYQLFFRFETFPDRENTGNIFEKEIAAQQGAVKLIIDHRNYLTVTKDGAPLYQYDLMGYVKTIYAKYGVNGAGPKPRTAGALQEPMMVTAETPAVKILVVLNSVNGSADRDTDQFQIDNMEGEVFLTVK